MSVGPHRWFQRTAGLPPLTTNRSPDVMETIEQATVEDIPELVELLTILFAQEADFTPDPRKQARGLKLIIDNPAVGAIFVTRDKGTIVGMVSLLFTVSTAEGGR